jgi:hypothetical protein
MSLEDSVRGYFSFRYVIPGYIFILFVIGLNIFPLITFGVGVGKPELFGSMLAFATLLTGGAVGFVVSQFWWLYFNLKGSLIGMKEFNTEFKLIEKYTQNLPSSKKAKSAVLEAISDLNIFLMKNKTLTTHVWRRWDIYHVLRSSVASLILSLITGVVVRTYLVYFFPDTCNLAISELLAISLIIVAAFILGVVFYYLSRLTLSRYYPLHKAFSTLGLTENIDKLKEAFPEYFSKDNEKILIPDATCRIE